MLSQEKSSRRTAPLALALMLGGCMTGPNNGDTFASPIANLQTVTFTGYDEIPNNLITIQQYNGNTSTWVPLKQTYTSSSATYWNSSKPIYAWTVTPPLPFATADTWPQGGILHVRAYGARNGQFDGRQLTIFDEDYDACFQQHMSEPWEGIGQACASPYATGWADLISTTPTPSQTQAPPAFISSKNGPNAGEAETILYYQKIGAPATLAAFKQKYGFGTSGTDEVRAFYYNNGDLGLGRDMRCKSFVQVIANVPQIGRACYVTNYGRDSGGNVVFGDLDGPSVVDDQILNTISPPPLKAKKIATVAMVYLPPISAANSVQFIVYGENDSRQNFAQLDANASNTAVPQNCLSCHGGGTFYDDSAGAHVVGGGARFLPFDPFSFQYGTKAGASFGAQADGIRRLNAHVMKTEPTEAIKELLNGMYQDPNNGAQLGPANANAVATYSFIPSGWTDSAASKKLYQETVGPYCRTCHVSQSSLLSWRKYSDFIGASSSIIGDLCSSRLMPNAQLTNDHQWASSSRAHVLSAFGYQGPCNP